MRYIIKIILLVLIVKIVYFIFASYFIERVDLNILNRNDSGWYETIAINGHSKITPDQLGKCEDGNIQQSYYAFFPLYPAILGLTLKLTGLTFNTIAFIYSIIFSIMLFLIFFKYISQIFASQSIGFYATIILILFPFHYYFSVYYTEALFLFLLIGSFYSIKTKRFVLFSVLSSLLVLVRPNGMLMLIPLFIYFFESHYSLKPKELCSKPVKEYIPILIFIIPIVIFLLYCTYLKIMTGDFFAYKTAQAGWCRETVFPWVPILRCSNWMDYFRTFYLFFFIAVSLIQIRKIPLSFTLLIWISLLLPIIANRITDPRYISVIFVFPMIFGKMMDRWNYYVRIVILLLLFSAQLWSFYFWIIGSEFSY
jgi:Gpi18-like mannosyltransferase